MKYGLAMLAIIFFSAVGLTFNYSQYADLLNEEDQEWIYSLNQEGPYMTSAPGAEKAWESYFEWLCFSRKSIELSCVTYDEDTLVPSISAVDKNHTYLFDLHVEDGLECQSVLHSWHQLIDDAQICVMAALMPGAFESDPRTSLWYMNAIKTTEGYWILEENLP